MVATSTNQAWLVLTGVEKLLETEFEGSNTSVYFSDVSRNKKSRAIRLNTLPGEELSRIASMVTDRHNIEVNLEYPKGTNKRISMREAFQMIERIKRVLVNNCAYSPDGTYRWHDGAVEERVADPDRPTGEEEGDTIPSIAIVDVKQLLWGVTVSEALPA